MGRKLPAVKADSVARGAGEWLPTTFSRRLSGRAARSTSPEKALRSALHGAGLRFRLHPRLGSRLTGDILLLPRRICIFVDGCFWHQCGKHKLPPKQGPNAQLWAEKFAKTRRRDDLATRLAQELGYDVARVWECDIKSDLEHVVERIKALARKPVATVSAGDGQ